MNNKKAWEIFHSLPALVQLNFLVSCLFQILWSLLNVEADSLPLPDKLSPTAFEHLHIDALFYLVLLQASAAISFSDFLFSKNFGYSFIFNIRKYISRKVYLLAFLQEYLISLSIGLELLFEQLVFFDFYFALLYLYFDFLDLIFSAALQVAQSSNLDKVWGFVYLSFPANCCFSCVVMRNIHGSILAFTPSGSCNAFCRLFRFNG